MIGNVPANVTVIGIQGRNMHCRNSIVSYIPVRGALNRVAEPIREAVFVVWLWDRCCEKICRDAIQFSAEVGNSGSLRGWWCLVIDCLGSVSPPSSVKFFGKSRCRQNHIAWEKWKKTAEFSADFFSLIPANYRDSANRDYFHLKNRHRLLGSFPLFHQKFFYPVVAIKNMYWLSRALVFFKTKTLVVGIFWARF